MTPEIQIPQFLTNPLDDALIVSFAALIRLVFGKDKPVVRVVAFFLPFVIRWMGRAYKEGYIKDRLTHVENDLLLLKNRLHRANIKPLG